jgi:antitoxin (DNA-binding transcriptional repressor) of toxin-antitoxin stability system
VLRAVEAGETFVVTRDGHPVAELRPINGPQRFVRKEVLLATSAELPPIDGTLLRRDLDDAIDDQVRDPCTGKPI